MVYIAPSFTCAEQQVKCVATTLGTGVVSDRVAVEALEVTTAVVSNMDDATRAGQASAIVAATVDVFRGVAQLLGTQNGHGIQDNATAVKAQQATIAGKLNDHASGFCNSLTRNGVPGDTAVSSASGDFVFNCQKNEQQARGGDSVTDQAQYNIIHIS